ncbi:MAG: carotenoid 1,2-hydratase [Chloroflexi bacterium]|nr:carotenoid 1,2-hydratase [Chloroflexota bacterium]
MSKSRILFIIFTLAIFAVILLTFLTAQPSPRITASIVGLQASNEIAGYARAERIRDFKFPDDHGPHPEFQTEWWYYTGNLQARDGRRFGYQLTFFRRAITPTAPPRESDWGTNQIYFAHFALTDVKNNRHTSTERFSRGAGQLAGARGDPFRVWIENWNVETVPSTPLRSAQDATSLHNARLIADEPGYALDLMLTSRKPLVLHGERGLSQKSVEPGNASYYISFTRLDTEGTITINDEKIAVQGLSWMDHEWSTAVLGKDAVGWDWFSIQLDDHRELMLFQIRQKDGSIEPLSSGTLIEADGTTRALTRDQFSIQVLTTWTSPHTRAIYPARWNVAIPSADIALTITPRITNQEMNVSIVYWEGAVAVEGKSRGASVRGSGYVEMTGYAITR